MRDVRAGVQKWYRHMLIMIISHKLSGRSSLSIDVIGDSPSEFSLMRSKLYYCILKLRQLQKNYGPTLSSRLRDWQKQ